MIKLLRLFLILFLSHFSALAYSDDTGSKHICIDLKVGQSTLINQNNSNDFLTSISAKYRLTKVSEKNYISEIAVEFYTKDLDITKKDLFDFRSRVQECLSRTSNLLNGPNNENLQIQLAKNNSTFSAEAIISIEVSKTVPRENARHYALSSDCPTLMHEILHLHGLVDEYPEFFPDIGEKFLSCRHLGIPTSVMYNPWVAYDHAEQKSMDTWDYEAKDASGTLVKNEVSIKTGTVFPIEGLKKLGAKNIKMIGTLVRNSLLSNQQFNIIIHPGCDVNNLYYSCSANSTRVIYPKNSTVNGKAAQDIACLQTSAECMIPENWAGNPELFISN